MQFNLVIHGNTHPVNHYGVDQLLKSPPTVTISMKGDGMCLFNSLSLLLTDHNTYNAIIRHVICNYIDNPIKYAFLKQYIPERFKSGKEYTVTSRMHTYTTWGTEVEIIAFAQLSGFDVMVFTEHKTWACYKHDPLNKETSDRAFYLMNESGYHFDPIFNGIL